MKNTNYTNCDETRIPPIITNFRRISPALVAGNSGARFNVSTFQDFNMAKPFVLFREIRV